MSHVKTQEPINKPDDIICSFVLLSSSSVDQLGRVMRRLRAINTFRVAPYLPWYRFVSDWAYAQSPEQRNLICLAPESGIVHQESAGSTVHPCGHLVNRVRAFNLRPPGPQVYYQVRRLLWESRLHLSLKVLATNDIHVKFYLWHPSRINLVTVNGMN